MCKFWKSSFLSFALCMAITAVYAQTPQDPWAAWQARDYVTALTGFRVLAESGDAKAQEQLGQMYKTGEGVPKNDALAQGWLRKAEEQRNVQWQRLTDAFVGRSDARAYGVEPFCD